jgi:hypothetical protein
LHEVSLSLEETVRAVRLFAARARSAAPNPNRLNRPKSIAPPPECDDAAVADTVTDFVAVPPAPVQLSENVVVEATETARVPEFVAWLPVKPVPVPVQDVALVEVHVSVVVPPAETLVGEALKVTVGVAFTI